VSGRRAPTVTERQALDRDRLCAEVQRLRALLNDFGPVPGRPTMDNIGLDYRRGEGPGTREPKNATRQALEDTGTDIDRAAEMKIQRAIAADIDGALTDIRAMRTIIEDIAEQPDVRARFKAWITRKRR
jgi:hypothetical protein